MITQPIITQRLSLHPLRREDEAAAVEIMRSDLVNPTYMLPDLDDAGAKALFTHFLQITEQANRLLLGVYLEDRLIGWLNDTEICGDTMELGWVIRPDFWGQGYATEAVSAALKALHQKGFRCIYAGAFSQNTASLRVMQKAGMTLQNKTECLEYRGKVHHCIFYASIQ
jgi:RimJ/RimL family protein N-acetyltransferase